MILNTILTLAALALAPLVSAQARLQFTTVPGPFTIGRPAEIKWTGGTSDSVTLILREGADSRNLSTVGIIASNLKGTSYTWTPAAALVPGDSYALQITQGLDGTNYSGLFSILAANAGNGTAGTAGATGAGGGSATMMPNATSSVTTRAGTGTAASASGTGINVPRNTTMVSPTLSTSATITATTTGTRTGTGTGTGTGASSSTGAAAIAQATAQAMFGLGAIAAAAVYLL